MSLIEQHPTRLTGEEVASRLFNRARNHPETHVARMAETMALDVMNALESNGSVQKHFVLEDSFHSDVHARFLGLLGRSSDLPENAKHAQVDVDEISGKTLVRQIVLNDQNEIAGITYATGEFADVLLLQSGAVQGGELTAA